MSAPEPAECDCESCRWLRSLTDDELQMKLEWLLQERARRIGTDLLIVTLESVTAIDNTDKGKLN